MPVIKIPVRKELWVLSAILLIGVFIVSPGFFSIDEAIYYLGARAIAEHGVLGFDNGFNQLQSESLKLRFLIDGPQGLTPQYPAGSAVLGGLLIPFLGAKAFTLINALAAVGTLFTVRKICLNQFKSETISRIAIALLVAATFWVQYALGQWPHMLAAFFAIQAYWFALRHLDSDAGEYRYALLSGLFAGLGMLFRLDAILVVPAIGLILLLFARRFVRSSFLFGAGIAPSFVLSSGLNVIKFGSMNPLSYGKSGGNTDLTAHGVILAALCVGFGLLLLIRWIDWKVERRVALGGIAIAGALLLLIPPPRAVLLQFWNGFVALVVDMRMIVDHRLGVEAGPGNTMIFIGLSKKALGQSMPWIGLAALLLTGKISHSERRPITTLLIFIATMTVPFIWLSWHGGGGSNMRYFLPILPALCILCAKPLLGLWRHVPNAIIVATAGLWATIGVGVAWALLHPSGYVGVQQILTVYVLLATALAAMAAGIDWQFQQAARGMALALFAGGLVLSMTAAVADFSAEARWRSTSYEVNKTVGALPPKSLIITHPEWVTKSIPGNGSIAAVRDPSTEGIDQQLVTKALDAGYRVFLTSFEFDAIHDVGLGMEFVETPYDYPGGRIIELRRLTRHWSKNPAAQSRPGPDK